MDFLDFFNAIVVMPIRAVAETLRWEVPGTGITLMNILVGYGILSAILKFFLGTGEGERIRHDKGESRR